MKIHSDTLTFLDIQQAVPRGCFLANFYHDGRLCDIVEAGSRSHKRSFIVRLSGTSKSTMDTRNMPEPEKAATYDEWGYFLAALFSKDESAKMGVYKDAADFDFKTGHAFPLVAS
jgi:hypothetical protein